MTTAQTPAGEPQLKPLWTDEMIRYEVEGWQLNCIESEISVVQDLMKKMRGPYEHDRRRSHQRTQALEARGVELEQQLAAARREVVEAKVGTWQPIEDDVFIESKGWRIVVGYVGSNDDALFIEEHCQDGIYTHAVFELRANIRLCELVDVPDAGGVPLVALTPELVSALKFFVGYSEHINDTNGGISPDSPWGIAYHALRKAIAGIDAAEGQAQDGS